MTCGSSVTGKDRTMDGKIEKEIDDKGGNDGGGPPIKERHAAWLEIRIVLGVEVAWKASRLKEKNTI